MAKENTDLDALLAAAENEIVKRERQEKKQEEKIGNLISDLDMRWHKISARPKSSAISFLSELHTEEKPVESLGFTRELMDVPNEEEREVERLKQPLQELREKISVKKAAVDAFLENDLLSPEKKEEIKKAWEVSSEEFEKEEKQLYREFSDKRGEATKKKQNYEQAQTDQKKFINDYRYGSKTETDGKSLFEKLITEGKDAQWFYENILTDEERIFIDELREKQKRGEEVLSQNTVDVVTSKTTERVKNEIDGRFEKGIESQKLLDSLFAVEERDKKVFDAAKRYIIDTLGEAAWGDLEKRSIHQAETSKEDIEAWREHQKGFGKNTSENRKKRLIETVEPLRKERETIYSGCLTQLNDIHNFLYELQQSRYRFEDNYGAKHNIENMEHWSKVSEELQEVARHVYEELPTKALLKHIASLKNATFLDVAPEDERSKKLEKLQKYLSAGRESAFRNLEKTTLDGQKDINTMSAKISQELDKFPPTPVDYYPLDIEEGIKKRRS